MNVDPLLKIIVHFAVFLETVPDDILDPAEATAQHEELAFRLGEIDDDARAALLACFRRAARQEKDSVRLQALKELPVGIGLLEDD